MAEDSEFQGASAGSAHSSRDKAFEIFVKRTITSIQKEAWGRSKEVKEIREACQNFLNILDQNGCTEETLKQVLYPLQLACSSSTTKVVELALGCLHKLVAHAWLHGESTPSGTMDMLSAHGSLDDDDTVANVIKMVMKCGETTNEALQLAVVRALLTFTTAEHFIAHGECLLAAVRAVFNLALGSENPINKRTACNALLQMLNTICKRVTQIQPRHTGDSICSSRTTSDAFEIFRSTSGATFMQHSPRNSVRASNTGTAGVSLLSPTAAAAEATFNGAHQNGSGNAQFAAVGSGYLSTASGQQQLLQYEVDAAAAAGDGAGSARAAQLAQLAKQNDLQGLEAALEASREATADDDEEASSTAEDTDYSAAAGAEAAAVFPRASVAADANGSAAATGDRPPALVQTVSSVGPAAGTFNGSSYQQYSNSMPPTPRAPAIPSGKPRHGKLTVQDKDVLLVLTAFCKLASREAPGNSSNDSVLAQGKLLALEMLAKVLSNPYHNWEHIPENFCKQLRQPLCLALLRNCAASDPVAYSLALRLLVAILCLPRLRTGLRAELGAFYPLLVLRCLEQQQAEQANVQAALGALQGLLAEPQLLVDLYVNFDCDLQASNLYERTVQVLSKLAQSNEPDADTAKTGKAGPEAAATAAGICKEALACCLQVIAAMESWAKPIKDAALRASETDSGPSRPSQGANFSNLPSMERELDSSNSLPSSTSNSAKGISEAERLAAAKNTKELMAKGVNLFNTKGALKGVEFLMSQGLLESSPAAVASFLRNQHDQLDKAHLGELLGHHEDFAIAIMHAWIDSEPSMTSQAIDQALRRLLGGFRLPGEAQKIDRIMEKFAERYCKDNPGRFANADAAYVLSFAVIMLNTDAHNPSAERRLGKADFVAMNHQPTEDSLMVSVLPVSQLEDIYDRVVHDEIMVRGETSSKDFATSRTSTRNRLAAAMGWTSVLQPFRSLTGNNSRGGGKDAQAHRRYLQEMAEREVVRAAASGNVWCSASHPEHVRPMLQVGGPLLLQALSVAFTAATDAASAAPLLAGLLQLARLSGLLGLDRQCEACVGALAARCGVFDPAPMGSPAEGKQLAALQALLGLTSGPDAGFLGSSWVIILRCVSALDALRQELTRPLPVPTAPASKDASGSNPFSRMFQSMFGTGSISNSSPTSPVGSGGGSASAGSAGPRMSLPAGVDISGDALRDSMDGSKRPTIRDAPGAGLVLWAESAAGAVEMERPYARSATLDGDAVVVFMRALCAISQEELEAAGVATSAAGQPPIGLSAPINIATAATAARTSSPMPGFTGGPRLFSLQKVVECAYQNMGRIRLVWSKLWAVIAAQLVGASCHPHRRVALYAVDSLRQLVAKLLARAELEHFTHQEDALRPFVAVLRQCDEAPVRELAVQCVMQAVTSHPKGLGSGWRMVIIALRLGAADSSPAVMAQTQEALQVVVDTLYTGTSTTSSSPVHGHTFLRETVQAIVAGIRNPAHLELSMSAVQLLGRCGQQLAAYEDAGGRDEAPAAAATAGGVDLDGDYGWGLLLRTLADVVQHDRRPQVVDAALEMVFALLTHYSQRWDASAWRVLIQRVLQHMLALPASLGTPYDYGSAVVPSAAVATDAASKSRSLPSFSGFVPQLSAAAQAGAGGNAAAPAAGRGAVGLSIAAAGSAGAGGAVPANMSAAEQSLLMTNLLQRMDRYYPMLCEQAAVIRPEYKVELIQQLVAIGVCWYQQTSIYLSTAGIRALMRLADTVATIAASQSSSNSGKAAEAQTCSWALLLDPMTAAVTADVELVIQLATDQVITTAKQQQQQQQQPEDAGSRSARSAKGRTDSPSGSPRVGKVAASAVTNDAASAPGGYSASPLGPKGGAAARQAVAAAAAEKQMAALQLRVRTQQLVMMQRALAAVHKRCKHSMSWEEQMQLLEALALGVDAAIAFNANMAVTYWHQQPTHLGTNAAASAVPTPTADPQLQQQQKDLEKQQQQQQQRQQQQSQRQPSIPEESSAGDQEQQPERSSSKLLLDSVDLASAVADAKSQDTSGLSLVGFGSYMQPAAANSTEGVTETAAAAAQGDKTDSSEITESDGNASGDSAVAGSGNQLQQRQQYLQPDLAPLSSQPTPAPPQQQHQQAAASSTGSPAAPGSSSSLKRLPGEATAPQPGSPGRTKVAGVAVPALLVTSASCVEEVNPALMRLEAEGGLLLLEVLDHSLQSTSLQTPAIARGRQRMLQLVRSIIRSEAACSTTAETPPVLERYGSTAVSNLSISNNAVDNPLQDALAGVGWEHAARAPLVVAALKILSRLQREDYRREVVQLFPALCRLMCSNHMLTRIALHEVISSQEFLDLLSGGKAS